MNASRNTRVVLGTVTIPEAGGSPDWSTPQRLNRFTEAGKIVHHLLRAPASSTVTAAEMLVFVDNEDADHTSFDGDAVPDERVIVHRTGITIAGSATAADDEVTLTNPGYYDLRGHEAAELPQKVKKALYVSYKGVTGTPAQANVAYRLTATDVT